MPSSPPLPSPGNWDSPQTVAGPCPCTSLGPWNQGLIGLQLDHPQACPRETSPAFLPAASSRKARPSCSLGPPFRWWKKSGRHGWPLKAWREGSSLVLVLPTRWCSSSAPCTPGRLGCRAGDGGCERRWGPSHVSSRQCQPCLGAGRLCPPREGGMLPFLRGGGDSLGTGLSFSRSFT